MATLVIYPTLTGFAVNDGAATAWDHDYGASQIAGGGIGGNEIRNFFKFNGSSLVGATINSIVFSVRLKDNRPNYYPNGAVWPYNTNGQGNIGLGTFATEFAAAVRANQYLTGQTNIAAADGTIISYTIPSGGVADFVASVAASGFWTFHIGFENDSNYGNGLLYVDDETVATAGNRPQILVDYTPGGPDPVDADVISNLETETVATADIYNSASVTSDLPTESVITASVSNSANVASDLLTESVMTVAVNQAANVTSNLETESAISAAVNQSVTVTSELLTESAAQIAVNNAAQVTSDLNTESVIAASVGISVAVVSDLNLESVVSVSVIVSADVTSDLELETEITAVVVSDDSEAVVISTLETESAISVDVNIGFSVVSSIELQTVVNVLNSISAQVNSEIELETLITADVAEPEISSAVVISTLELETAISAVTNVIAEIISDLELDSVIGVDVEDSSTSLPISNRFDRQIRTAMKLITKNGQKVIWRIITEVPDPVEPWKAGSQTTVNHVVSICFLPTNKQELESIAFRTGIEVPKGCVMGYMGNNGFEPNLKDIVIRNGQTLSVFYIDKLSPNGQNLLYTLLLKE